jgi:hypothetical protein
LSGTTKGVEQNRGIVDQKNSDLTKKGANFVYNLQGQKESKIGDENRREFQGSEASEEKSVENQKGENSEVGVKARRQQRG